MRCTRLLAAVATAFVLVLPSSASAAGFGPTEPLAESPPSGPASPVFASLPDNNTLRLTRFFSDSRPPSTVDLHLATGNVDDDLHVAANPRGDALVTWTENGGSTHVASAIFWPAGAPAPDGRHELLTGSEGAHDPWSVLDPDGSATIVFQLSGLRQVTTDNAGAADPWGEPTADLGRGGGAGASLPDGRAVLGITEEVRVTNPDPAHSRYWKVHATTRVEGQPFRPPAFLDGAGGSSTEAPTRFPVERLPAVGISPAGRALVAWVTTKGDNPSGVCDPYEREVHAALGFVAAGIDAPTFSSQLISDAGAGLAADTQDLAGVRAGPDDRLAVVWKDAMGCWNQANRAERRMAAYTTPGETTLTPTGEGIPGSPAAFRGFWWRADGKLLFWTQTTNPIQNFQTVYDTGVPVSGAPGGGDGGGGGGPGPAPPGPPAPPPPPGGGPTIVPALRPAFKASANGTVRMTVAAPGAGALAVELLAKRSALVSAKKPVRVRRYTRTVAKAGAVKLKLALKGKAKKTLKKRHKLKITVVTSFKPAGGGTTQRATRTVTFKLKR